MATVAELLVKISGDSSGLRKEIAASQRQIKRGFGTEALASSAGAADMLLGLAAAAGIAGVAAIKMSSDYAASKTAFTTLLGSADAAEKMMADLATFAADTPFELPGLIKASQKLLAFKFAGEDIIPIMSAVGNAIALVGGGEEAIDGVVRALGQIQAKGKLSAEEMNQLAERGINGWQYLADEMGISVAAVMKLCQDGAIDSTTAINAVVKGMQSNFAGGMDAMSKTVPGLLSTIKDNAGLLLKEIGDQLTDSLNLTDNLAGIGNFLNQFTAAVKGSGIKAALQELIPPELIAGIFALSGAITGAAIPAMALFAGNAWKALVPLAPLIVAGAAIGLLAYEIWNNWEPLATLFGSLWTAISTTFSALADTLTTVWTNITDTVTTAWAGIMSVLTTAWDLVLPVIKAGALAIGVVLVGLLLPVEVFAAAVYLIYDNWGEISSFFSGIWSSITGVFTNAWDAIASVVSSAWDTITSVISGAWDSIVSFLSDQLGWLVDLMSNAWDEIVSTVADVWDSIIDALSSAWDMILSVVTDVAAWVTDTINSAWDTVSDIFSTVWYGVSDVVSDAWESIKSIVASGVAWVMSKLSPLLDLIKAAIPDSISNLFTSLGDSVSAAADSFHLGAPDAGGGGDTSAAPEKPNTTFTGLHNTPSAGDTGGGGKGAKGKEDKSGEKLAKKAAEITKQINKEWTDLTGTKLDSLDNWYQEELTKLNASASANENYEQDLTRLNEVYAVKRQKIITQEKWDKINAFDQIANTWESTQKELTLGALTGSAKEETSAAFDTLSKIKSVEDDYQKIMQNYEEGTKEQKDNIIAALDDIGVKYVVTAQGTLDFTKQIADDRSKYMQMKNQEDLNNYQTCKDVQADIDAAYTANSMSMLQQALTDENAVRENDYAAQKSMMDTWQAAMLAANSTSAQLMADLYSSGFTGIQTAISDMLTGTESITDAFKALGKTLLKTIADWVAKWIAGQLMMSVFGKTTMAAQTAVSVAAAAITAKAWAKAAAMVSLASWGANGIPAAAAITATTALADGLATVPGLATGGVTTGPTLALIGEGRYKEAVVPLEKGLFAKLMDSGTTRTTSTNVDSGAKVTTMFNNYGDVNTGSDLDELYNGVNSAVLTGLRGI